MLNPVAQAPRPLMVGRGGYIRDIVEVQRYCILIFRPGEEGDYAAFRGTLLPLLGVSIALVLGATSCTTSPEQPSQ